MTPDETPRMSRPHSAKAPTFIYRLATSAANVLATVGSDGHRPSALTLIVNVGSGQKVEAEAAGQRMTAMPGPPGGARYFCQAPRQQVERTPGVGGLGGWIETRDK